MDDFGFDGEFDFDAGNFLDEAGNDVTGLNNMAAAGFLMGDDDDMGDDGDNGDRGQDDLEPYAKRQKQQAGDYASGQPYDGDAPPVIDNVTAYLPNVAPAAFPVIISIIAQATIPVGPDLRKLSCATRNVEFMPKSRNASATMRLQEPNAVVTIRSSGSMSVVGAASISEARQAAELAARIIRKALDLDFQTLHFRIRSIGARFNACSPVRLNELANFRLDRSQRTGLSEVHCSYEPERFNGCVVKLVGASQDNKWIVTCLVFVTGKVTMMGARSMEELRFSFDALVPLLAQFIGPTPASAAAESGTNVA